MFILYLLYYSKVKKIGYNTAAVLGKDRIVCQKQHMEKAFSVFLLASEYEYMTLLIY